MDNDNTDISKKPTRRDVVAGAGAAALTLSVTPAMANIAPQLMRHASREIILEFDIPAGNS